MLQPEQGGLSKLKRGYIEFKYYDDAIHSAINPRFIIRTPWSTIADSPG